MKKIKLFVFMMLGMSCLFQSCKDSLAETQPSVDEVNKELQNARKKYLSNVVDETIKSDFIVKDGILHFKDLDSYKKIKSSFSASDMQKRIDFAKENGFENLFSVTSKALEEISKVKSKDEYDNLLNKYEALLLFDVETNSVSSKFKDGGASVLLNKDGLVYIGKMLYKFDEDSEIIVLDGDISKIKTLKNKNIVESPEMALFKTKVTPSKSERACKYFGRIESSTGGNALWRGKLEGWASDVTYYPLSNGNYDAQGHVYIRGVAMFPSVWGSWYVDQKTPNTLGVNFDLTFFAWGGYNNPLSSEPFNFTYQNDWWGIDYDAYSWTRNFPAYLKDHLQVGIVDDLGWGSRYGAKYNHNQLGPGQWLYPYDCHSL